MDNLTQYVSPEVLPHLSLEERAYLSDVFARFGGYPSLNQVWALMDEPWAALRCDPGVMDERVGAFYGHPVWLLNGLFIEQDEASLANRRAFTEWIVQRRPGRVADFGGGFGGLARFVGKALPDATVEVIEPHPRPAAVAMAASTPNVRFVDALSGEYDVIIATDVFEHVPDPLGLCADTARFLAVGGDYLIANCFFPVIQCHLPQLFHFQYGWDPAMVALGLRPGAQVRYGRAYRRTGALDLAAARRVAARAEALHRVLKYVPRGRMRLGNALMGAWGALG